MSEYERGWNAARQIYVDAGKYASAEITRLRAELDQSAAVIADRNAELAALKAEHESVLNTMAGLPEALAASERKLAALKAEREWRPIETLPRDGNDYLVCDRRVLGGNQMVVAWDEDDNDYPLMTADGPAYPLRAFTHWARLPAPPEAGDE